MRNTQETGVGRGAVMWLNVGYEPDRFAPIFGSLVRQPDGTKRLQVVSAGIAILKLPGLGTGMVEITLDLDVDAKRCRSTSTRPTTARSP